MHDAIVVGARCAGAPTAMLLARRGYRVLLVDRSELASDIPHGHFIHRHGPRRLHGWGLLDRITASGCPAISEMTLDVGAGPLTGVGLVAGGVALGYGPRRSALDRILVDGAVEAGALLAMEFSVDELVCEGERVVGIRGRDRQGGSRVTELAPVVIGADGRNSLLARTVRAPEYEVTPPLTCWFFSYWSGVPGRAIEIYSRRQRVIFAFPTSDGLFAVFVAWPSEELAAVRSDIEAQLLAVLDEVPELAERVRGGKREERFRGATDLPNFLRRPYGPGWALVGDAGCHKDPFLALGCCDAFRDAELVTDALDAALSGRQPFDEAMAGYEERRNAATMADYRENLAFARFQPPPAEQVRLMAALRGNQEATNQLFLAREGMIPPESFFNPENLGRLMAAAG